MRLKTRLILAGMLLALAVGLGQITHQAWTVYATPATQSRFLRSLNLDKVVNRYGHFGQSWQCSETWAGSRCPWRQSDVRHRVDRDWFFRPKGSGDYEQLMADLLVQTQGTLAGSGATITSEKIEDSRFTVSYRAGHSTGQVQVEYQSDAIEHPNEHLDRVGMKVKESWAVRQ